jgi:kynurenine 3-monooxygenase
MVPFYGQGMNSGLEDVRILFEIIDSHLATVGVRSPSSSMPLDNASSTNKASINAGSIQEQIGLALKLYSEVRAKDAAAINDLALANYTEMRASVVSPIYLLRKWMEETLSVYIPSLGWQTKYSRVSFGNERYSEVVAKSERQGKLLMRSLVGLVVSPFVIGGLVAWTNWDRNRRTLRLLTKLRDAIIGRL